MSYLWKCNIYEYQGDQLQSRKIWIGRVLLIDNITSSVNREQSWQSIGFAQIWIQNRVSASLSFTWSSYYESERDENATQLLPPQCAGGIWIRRFHYETFSVHTTPEKVENTTIMGHCGFVFTWLSLVHRFLEKLRLQNVIIHTKTQSRRFQFLRFEERFRQLRFRDR